MSETPSGVSASPFPVDSWVTFRPAIKVLDCTIRDGGLINDHRFDDDFVRRIYETNIAAGIDIMELGYKADRKIFRSTNCGAWKFCEEEDIRRIVGENNTSLKLSVMADAGRTDYRHDILPKEKSVIDIIRVAAYIHQIPLAVDMIRDAAEKGYQVTFNLMAISGVQDRELMDALVTIAQTPVEAIYLVDSFGSLYGEQVRDLTQKYLRTGKAVGFHGHNNQQLAYANTIEALIVGATWLDATYAGLGRGAGNCPMELLVGFLKNPKFKLRPILQCVQDLFVPLSKTMDWGYSIPYMITGQLNLHPRDAIAWRAGPTPDDYVGFYDKMVQEDS